MEASDPEVVLRDIANVVVRIGRPPTLDRHGDGVEGGVAGEDTLEVVVPQHLLSLFRLLLSCTGQDCRQERVLALQWMACQLLWDLLGWPWQLPPCAGGMRSSGDAHRDGELQVVKQELLSLEGDACTL